MNTKQMAYTALMAAVISVLAPIAIELSGGVPVSLATLAVMLAGGLLGSRYGTLGALVYILLGMIGMPVFAGYSSGAHIVFGMTGGYILGYLPLAYCTGWFAEHYGSNIKSLVSGTLLGNLVLYILGTLWFMVVTKMGLIASLTACVIPFLPGDLLKIAVVCILVPRLSRFLHLQNS